MMILQVADGDEKYPYAVRYRLGGQHLSHELTDWCHEMYNSDRFYIGYFLISFSDESDRNWFLLRWT